MQVALPTVDLIESGRSGPCVALFGGIHGDEFEGVLAARSLARTLRSVLTCGTVRVVAPAHPAAWGTCSRESPLDGANLARVFPGRVDGTPTERVAYFLTNHVLCGSDALIDLHSAGSRFVMPFLCGYNDDGSSRAAESGRLAHAFGAEFVWRHAGALAPGRSLSAASELGIPAIYVEAQGGLSVRSKELQGYIYGVINVLHALGMSPPAAGATGARICVCGDGNTDAGITVQTGGFFVRHVEVGGRVGADDALGEILDEYGNTLERVVAPAGGYVMMLRRDARVGIGDTIGIVAAVDDNDDMARR